MDLKRQRLYVTANKYNDSLYKYLAKIQPHETTSSEAISAERNGAEGFSGSNFLGGRWHVKNEITDGIFPSLN